MYELSEIRPGENLHLFACSSPEVINSVLVSMLDGAEGNIDILVEPVEGILDTNRIIFYPYVNGGISAEHKYSASALVFADNEEEISECFKKSLFGMCTKALNNSVSVVKALLKGKYRLDKFHVDYSIEDEAHKILIKYAKA